MSKYYLTHDASKCVSCQACEVQCKTHHNLPVGPNLCQIQRLSPEEIHDPLNESFVFMACFHCEEAACLDVCPTTAIQRREKDSIVHIEAALCIGCRSCMTACAWGAIQWNPDTKKATKCDLCMDRLDAGLKPSCVTVCLTSCMDFVPEEELPAGIKKYIVTANGHPEVIQ